MRMDKVPSAQAKLDTTTSPLQSLLLINSQMIHAADRVALGEAKRVFANSKNDAIIVPASAAPLLRRTTKAMASAKRARERTSRTSRKR